MKELSAIEKNLLAAVADLHDVPQGAYNIRANGQAAGRKNTADVEIVSKTDKPGIDIIVKPGAKRQSIHIPVVVSQTGLVDLVYNDFYIGDDADVVIVAGCGIHNDGSEKSQHDGIHTFHIGKRARVSYVEKHYGEGKGTGERVLNPQTIAYLDEGASAKFEMVQIRGVDDTHRDTKCYVGDNADIVITERLLTSGKQNAVSDMDVRLEGYNSRARMSSRTVAQDDSVQIFYPRATGTNKCFAHIQCDSIIMGHGSVRSIPEVTASHVDAQLIHEAAIGRIAGDQILKMMTLGLTEEEAEEQILNGFLR